MCVLGCTSVYQKNRIDFWIISLTLDKVDLQELFPVLDLDCVFHLLRINVNLTSSNR
jgi:hypothetical protein